MLPLGRIHRQMMGSIRKAVFNKTMTVYLQTTFSFSLFPESLGKSYRPVVYECFWSHTPLKNMFGHTLPIHVCNFSIYKLRTSSTEGLTFSSHIPVDFNARTHSGHHCRRWSAVPGAPQGTPPVFHVRRKVRRGTVYQLKHPAVLALCTLPLIIHHL